MIVTCVQVHVRPGRIEDFKRVTTANHLESVKEPGNLRFDMLQDASDPEKFMLYEAYESEEAAAAHKTTPHYAIWRDTVGDWMAGPRKGTKYNIVVPLDKELW
jgi:(4S)-4-hydroxy-5-phosphonooxypentane-2,3-dione isomerase